MYKNRILLLFLALSLNLFAQKYEFKILKDNLALPVTSQGQTGTCWSFATSSFVESEIYRLTGEQIDVAEMYIVRNTYEKKAWNYVMRQGHTQFSEGGLAHDVMDAIANGGIVPQANFKDVLNFDGSYNHAGVIQDLKKIMDAYIKNDNDSEYPNWKEAIAPILDKRIGIKPSVFEFNNKAYTPKAFAEFVKINPKNYVTLTSFTHEPYYSEFVLNIPDNFSNGSFYNLPLDTFVKSIIIALEKGYTVALDADVSEKTFMVHTGVAVLPSNEKDSSKAATEIVAEIEVTPESRQKEFENYNTTDDHLMHIVGLVKDQNGTLYFKVKNSWGSNSARVGNGGFVYMSYAYIKQKAISVLLHKDAIEKELRTKLKI